ncbi:MAG: RNA polymerase sigma factor [Sedimentisphaerales bacterium]|nr:RNA polymerase sigma factor [Sedimentisphaerales bacterium]
MPVEPSENSADNLTVCAQHDPDAFAQLYRRHYDGIFRYCVHRLFDRATAQDITATIFIKALENLSGFRGDEQAFARWLYRIAGNTIISHWRKESRRKKMLTEIAQSAAASKSALTDNLTDQADEMVHRKAVLQKALFSLKPLYQEVVTLRFFEKMTSPQIARILSCSDATVRSRLARALAKMRKIIQASGKDFDPEVI